jgi:MFS family permease
MRGATDAKTGAMNPSSAEPVKFTFTHWLILAIASIGFLFDTYELLMTPLVGVPAIAELLQVPPNNPLVTKWMGNLLWLSALSGGVFGLLGGWLIDRFGRKRIMAASIFLYALSPCAAAFSTSLETFIFFRCTTFIGVCVEFVAAITWLAELFPNKRQKEIALGATQAFASLGGLLVTGMSVWVLKHASSLPALPVSELFNTHATWRYTLLTGFLPAIPIALMLPFVPESKVWRDRRAAGTLKRPSFAELFSPALRRTTLVTAGLSACAYGAAFGALQLTPLRVAPGMADLAGQRQALKPLQDEAKALNQQLDEVRVRFEQACIEVAGLREIASARAKSRIAMRGIRKSVEDAGTDDAKRAELQGQLAALTNRLGQLDGELNQLTVSKADAKKAVLEREKILGQLGANREKQEPFDTAIKARGNKVQFWQEMGGLAGRIALAFLLVVAITRRTLLRLFLLPGLLVFPLTYLYLFKSEPDLFVWGIAAAGFLTVAQFSYFGEYLPKVFPLHLRGTGGSFATNVGGRMLGTSGAFVTANLVAPRLPGSTFEQVATGAAIVGTAVFVIGLLLSFLLPEPKQQDVPE